MSSLSYAFDQFAFLTHERQKSADVRPSERARLRERIRQLARARGFIAAGFVRTGPVADFPRYEAYLEAGRHGEMTWMENHLALRADTANLEEGMRTIIALLCPYSPTRSGDNGAHNARYAQGDDYHEVLRAQMRELATDIERELGAPLRIRPATDSAPVLERSVAAEAGLGWIGKSTMLIHEQAGTYTLLAELFVDLDLCDDEAPPRVPDRCGRCTRCLDACPTGAFVGPYELDARRCISYLTIELRGPIPPNLREGIGEHLFGCDICQEVCPWNRFAQPVTLDALAPRREIAGLRPEEVLTMTQQEFSATFRRSAMKRSKRRGLARNAAVVVGNRRRPADLKLLCVQLEEHDEALVRGHVAWALSCYSPERSALHALDAALHTEHDNYVRQEIEYARERWHRRALAIT